MVARQVTKDTKSSGCGFYATFLCSVVVAKQVAMDIKFYGMDTNLSVL